MNKARQMYLNMHLKIDFIDYIIHNAKTNYRTCKYWNSPINHVKALDVVVSYDMYIEYAEVKFNESCHIREPMTFWEFREKLSKKIIAYKPNIRFYWGDYNMRVYVAQISKQQKRGRKKTENYYNNTIASNTFKGVRHTRHRTGRLCGDMEIFQKHVLSRVNLNNPKPFEVCGIYSYTICGLCKATIHYLLIKVYKRFKIVLSDFTVIPYLG